MRKSEVIVQLEERFQRPIELIVADAYTQCGSYRAAADFLGVNPNTFYSWIRTLPIRRKKLAEVTA